MIYEQLLNKDLQDTLSEVLSTFGKLKEDHKRLRKDYNRLVSGKSPKRKRETHGNEIEHSQCEDRAEDTQIFDFKNAIDRFSKNFKGEGKSGFEGQSKNKIMINKREIDFASLTMGVQDLSTARYAAFICSSVIVCVGEKTVSVVNYTIANALLQSVVATTLQEDHITASKREDIRQEGKRLEEYLNGRISKQNLSATENWTEMNNLENSDVTRTPCNKEQDIAYFMSFLHLPWWCSVQASASRKLLWRVSFVSILINTLSNSGCMQMNGTSASEMLHCVRQVFLVEFDKLLSTMSREMIKNDANLSCQNRFGAVTSFIAGLCRMIKDVKMYKIIMHAMFTKWATAERYQCVNGSSTLKVCCLTSFSVMENRQCSIEADEELQVITSILHFRVRSRKFRSCSDDVDRLLSKPITEIINESGKSWDRETLECLARYMKTYFALLGLEGNFKSLVHDCLVPKVVQKKSILACEFVIVPLIDIVADDSKLASYLDAIECKLWLEAVLKDLEQLAIKAADWPFLKALNRTIESKSVLIL